MKVKVYNFIQAFLQLTLNNNTLLGPGCICCVILSLASSNVVSEQTKAKHQCTAGCLLHNTPASSSSSLASQQRVAHQTIIQSAFKAATCTEIWKKCCILQFVWTSLILFLPYLKSSPHYFVWKTFKSRQKIILCVVFTFHVAKLWYDMRRYL